MYNRLGLYYSPLFFFFFQPFRYISIAYWMTFVGICFGLALLLVVKKLSWAAVFYLIGFGESLTFLKNGNIDAFILLMTCIIIDMQHQKPRGLIWGLLTFKPIFVLTFPFFLLVTDRIQRKQFMLWAFIGICINYGYFLFDFPLLMHYIDTVLHTEGLHEYILQYFGIRYGWLQFSILFCLLTLCRQRRNATRKKATQTITIISSAI